MRPALPFGALAITCVALLIAVLRVGSVAERLDPDVIKDGNVNSGDLGYVASCFGPVIGTCTPGPLGSITATWTPSPPASTSTSTPTFPGGGSSTATFTATPSYSPTATIIPTSTITPLATSTSTTGCTTNCGTPRFFCDTGSWAFCDDYRDLYCPVPDPFAKTDPRCQFPTANRGVSLDALSSSAPNYYPESSGNDGYFGSFFNQQEHFHTVVDDGNFGELLERLHQPFDFAGRTGHIHFEVDLKTSARRYVRLSISPHLVKSMTDDRSCGDSGCKNTPRDVIEVWFRGGPNGAGFLTRAVRNGNTITEYDPGAAYPGRDNVRDLVDVWVNSNRLRIDVNGVMVSDHPIGDAGFTRGYVYIEGASYNPCKDNECAANLQVFHWDNVAFDGPVLQRNSLTPVGFRDAVFNVFRTNSCTVNGVAATRENPPDGGAPDWATYTARLPDDGSALNANHVNCVYNHTNNTDVYGFEVVQ